LGYFIGCRKTSKEYMIYIHSSKRIIVTWDMKFQEEKTFRRSHEFPIDG